MTELSTPLVAALGARAAELLAAPALPDGFRAWVDGRLAA